AAKLLCPRGRSSCPASSGPWLPSGIASKDFRKHFRQNTEPPRPLANRAAEATRCRYVQRRALIVGGSMSGLLAALMLRRPGGQADIDERVAGELAGRGAGIVAQPALIAHLAALGLDTNVLGVLITRRQILDREGRVTLTGDCLQILTAWERVYRRLRDAFPSTHYHRGREFASFEQTARGIAARFSDGNVAESD